MKNLIILLSLLLSIQLINNQTSKQQTIASDLTTDRSLAIVASIDRSPAIVIDNSNLL